MPLREELQALLVTPEWPPQDTPKLDVEGIKKVLNEAKPDELAEVLLLPYDDDPDSRYRLFNLFEREQLVSHSELLMHILGLIEKQILEPAKNPIHVQAAKESIKNAFKMIFNSYQGMGPQKSSDIANYLQYIFEIDQVKDTSKRIFTETDFINIFHEMLSGKYLLERVPSKLLQEIGHLCFSQWFVGQQEQETKAAKAAGVGKPKEMPLVFALLFFTIVGEAAEKVRCYRIFLNMPEEALPSKAKTLTELINEERANITKEEKEDARAEKLAQFAQNFDKFLQSPLIAELKRLAHGKKFQGHATAALQLTEIYDQAWRIAVKENYDDEVILSYLDQAVAYAADAILLQRGEVSLSALEHLHAIHQELLAAKQRIEPEKRNKPSEVKQEVTGLDEDDAVVVTPTTPASATPTLKSILGLSTWSPFLESCSTLKVALDKVKEEKISSIEIERELTGLKQEQKQANATPGVISEEQALTAAVMQAAGEEAEAKTKPTAEKKLTAEELEKQRAEEQAKRKLAELRIRDRKTVSVLMEAILSPKATAQSALIPLKLLGSMASSPIKSSIARDAIVALMKQKFTGNPALNPPPMTASQIADFWFGRFYSEIEFPIYAQNGYSPATRGIFNFCWQQFFQESLQELVPGKIMDPRLRDFDVGFPARPPQELLLQMLRIKFEDVKYAKEILSEFSMSYVYVALMSEDTRSRLGSEVLQSIMEYYLDQEAEYYLLRLTTQVDMASNIAGPNGPGLQDLFFRIFCKKPISQLISRLGQESHYEASTIEKLQAIDEQLVFLAKSYPHFTQVIEGIRAALTLRLHKSPDEKPTTETQNKIYAIFMGAAVPPSLQEAKQLSAESKLTAVKVPLVQKNIATEFREMYLVIQKALKSWTYVDGAAWRLAIKQLAYKAFRDALANAGDVNDGEVNQWRLNQLGHAKNLPMFKEYRSEIVGEIVKCRVVLDAKSTPSPIPQEPAFKPPPPSAQPRLLFI